MNIEGYLLRPYVARTLEFCWECGGGGGGAPGK